MKDRNALTSGLLRDFLRGYTKLISVNFDEHRSFKTLTTDSRKVTSGDFFVAIKGEIHDGHDFIVQAVAQGAKAVLCERYPSGAPQDGVDIFLVEDSLKAFRILAGHWREHLDPVVIAVAGSVGKTTTKDLLVALLKENYPELAFTKGSQNGFLGIPLTLMDINSRSEAAVIEVGIDAPGAMIQHVDLVKPDVSLVTAISEEHLEWLKDLKTIAYEESLILTETSAAGGVAVINLDDPWLCGLWNNGKITKKVGFTLGGPVGSDILTGRLVSSRLEIEGLGKNKFEIDCPLPGEHNARNLLGAVAVAITLGVSVEALKKGLQTFQPSGGRSQWEQLPSGVRVLCDFYNANPASMNAAFKVVSDPSLGQGVRWLCLGDMKELGAAEESLHRGLACEIAGMSIPTKVLLFGEKMKWLKSELDVKNFKSEWFSDLSSMGQRLQRELAPKDILLIKGSRSMKMETLWNFLKNS